MIQIEASLKFIKLSKLLAQIQMLTSQSTRVRVWVILGSSCGHHGFTLVFLGEKLGGGYNLQNHLLFFLYSFHFRMS